MSHVLAGPARHLLRNWHAFPVHINVATATADIRSVLSSGLHTDRLATDGLEALEDPEAADAAQEGRWLAWVTASNELCLSHLPAPTRKGRGGSMAALHTLSLLPGEHIVQVGPTLCARCSHRTQQLMKAADLSTEIAVMVVSSACLSTFQEAAGSDMVPFYDKVCASLQVAWQMLREDVDAPGGVNPNQPPAVGAVLTSQRLLIVSPQLRVLVASPPAPGITSCLWLGPALLYATSDHQVGAHALHNMGMPLHLAVNGEASATSVRASCRLNFPCFLFRALSLLTTGVAAEVGWAGGADCGVWRWPPGRTAGRAARPAHPGALSAWRPCTDGHTGGVAPATAAAGMGLPARQRPVARCVVPAVLKPVRR